MLVDTHCHLNMMIKKEFDTPLTDAEIEKAKFIIQEAEAASVYKIINVGTSVIESLNCIKLAKKFDNVWATVGIHPNDLEDNWKKQVSELKKLVAQKDDNKICAIGEIGLDKHYPNYNINKQKNALKAQIELALENDLAIVIHTRDAASETFEEIEEFNKDISRAIIHCFSEDLSFAKQIIEWGFCIGLGGTITYPNNKKVFEVAQTVSLKNIVLETDAPFLPPQEIRGKQNNPAQIKTIAQFLSGSRGDSFEVVASTTTENAKK